jgi:DNA-binding response OmpR family regulator
VHIVKFDKLSAVVADDQKSSRDIVSEILRSVGMRDIRHADDGAVALRMLAIRPASFLVLDLEMPYDSVRTLRQLRRSETRSCAQIPVIMMTALATRSNVEAMRDAGANEIVVKPLTTAKLVGRTRAMLLHPRQFVISGSYVGPERRRPNSQPYLGPFRRESDILDEALEI